MTNVRVREPGTADSGSPIANFPPLLALLSALFVLATATLPLVSWRNVDSLVLAAFTVPIWLLDHRLVEPSVIVGSPLLVYLAARCLALGFGRASRTPARSLVWQLIAAWPPSARERVPKMVVAAATLLVGMVVLTSTGSGDVAFAALAGGTDVLHGTVPYGHIPAFIVHGDTYPLLTYLAYAPAAAVTPVYDVFSDPSGALFVAMAATLLAAAGLYRMAVLGAAGSRRGAAAEEPARLTGLRTMLAWLTLPPVILTASAGSNDPLLAASLVAVVVTFRRGRASAFLIGVAAWVKVIPVLALPVWLARLERRAALQALAALAALSAALVGMVVALGGTGAIPTMLHALAFQVNRGSLSSPWEGLGLAPLQPLAEAALVATIVAAAVAVRRERALRDDLPRMAALLAGIVLLAQVAGNYWTWAYLPWALAPMLVSLFASAPGPVDARPPHASGGRALSANRG